MNEQDLINSKLVQVIGSEVLTRILLEAKIEVLLEQADKKNNEQIEFMDED